MKQIFNLVSIVFILLGIACGFAYYYFIGCSSGSCPMRSNPWIMSAYGGLIGYLAGDVFKWVRQKLNRRS